MTTAASRPADRPPTRRLNAGPARRREAVADALESVLSDNTRRVYGAQWRLFERLVRLGGVARPCRRNP